MAGHWLAGGRAELDRVAVLRAGCDPLGWRPRTADTERLTRPPAGMSLPRVLCLDPPWRFGDALPGKKRGASRNYDTMTVEQLCDMRLPDLADDCYLFMWRVSAMVEEAYLVMRHWGFVPKSEIVWQKQTRKGLPWFGMGRTVRAAHETCIVAARGRPRPLVRNVRSIFAAPVPDDPANPKRYLHSGKPEDFYRLVETLAPGPYVEMFARRRRAGWICSGNELAPESA